MSEKPKVAKTLFFNEDECIKIIEYAHKKKDDLLKNGNNSNASIIYSKDQTTTANHYRYNFFYDNPQYINRFLKYIQIAIPQIIYPIVVQAWVNIYEKGQEIKWHNHAGLDSHSYAANIFLGGNTKPGIVYVSRPNEKPIVIENKLGQMLLSDCSMWHMVPLNKLETPRYTVGITIHDYEAITRELFSGASFNTINRGIIILTNE